MLWLHWTVQAAPKRRYRRTWRDEKAIEEKMAFRTGVTRMKRRIRI